MKTKTQLTLARQSSPAFAGYALAMYCLKALNPNLRANPAMHYGLRDCEAYTRNPKKYARKGGREQ